MNIQSSKMELRKFNMQDINDVFEYCSQDGVGENAGWAKHHSISQTEETLKEWVNMDEMLAIVDKTTKKVIGHIGIYEDSEEGRDDTRELGFVLNKDFHNKGIMTDVVKTVLDYLSLHNIKYVWACCFKHNIPSRKLIEKCGFEFMQEGSFYSESLSKEFTSYEYRMTLNNSK